MESNSNVYILTIYSLGHTFVGTLTEIASELDSFDFNLEASVESDDIFLVKADNPFFTLYFWDVFSMKVMPNHHKAK